jgi:hypothetical protein
MGIDKPRHTLYLWLIPMLQNRAGARVSRVLWLGLSLSGLD